MLNLARRFWLVCLLGSLAIHPAATAAENSYGTQAFTIIDNETGHVLDSYNGKKKRQIASLTKVATAMVVLDWAAASKSDLSQWAVVPDDIGKVSGTNPVGLAPGDFISVRDLIYCALLQSDNVAAHTLATHVGRAIKAMQTENEHDLDSPGTFVAQMNALARRLEMSHTLFLTPHGLEPAEGTLPFSTSDDLAVLTRYAMANKGFRFYVSQAGRKITIIRMLKPFQYLLKNTNELLGQGGIDGVKTGRTSRAGECLILSSAKPPETREENGKFFVTPRRVSIVLLGAEDRFSAGRQLLDHAWRLEAEWAAQGRPGGN